MKTSGFAILEARSGSSASGRPGAKKGLYFVDQSNQVWLASRDKSATLELEESGPQQVTLKATGQYRRPGRRSDEDNQWIVRIKAYANKPFVRVFHTIVFNASSEKRRTSRPRSRGVLIVRILYENRCLRHRHIDNCR